MILEKLKVAGGRFGVGRREIVPESSKGVLFKCLRLGKGLFKKG